MNVKFLYPSLTRKAVTFTIDDGNMKYDAMLLDILKLAGVKGTFNLCSDLHYGKEAEARDFYDGYGIANHCKHHPLVDFDGVVYNVTDEKFDESTADPALVYPVDDREGFFWVMRPNGWRQMVFEPDFSRYVEQGLTELRAIFGDGVKDFVWPYGNQDSASVHDTVKRLHRSSRITGCRLDLDGFSLPKDKYAWSYNANHLNLLEVMEKYEAYPDDGELKFFAFGVHSIDFERDGKWDDLRTFADRYGARPDEFWYATVEEIFDYEEAISALEISDGVIKNPGSVKVYLELDGEVVSVDAGGVYTA